MIEGIRNVYCDMCDRFQFPVTSGLPKGLCNYVMDEVGRKSTHAETCSGFVPARRCGCCGHYSVNPTQKNGKCELSGNRRSTGSTCAQECDDWVLDLLKTDQVDSQTIEQRYQALADVAASMWKLIKGIEWEYPRILDPNAKPGGQIVYPMPSEDFREQLEALEVHLDD